MLSSSAANFISTNHRQNESDSHEHRKPIATSPTIIKLPKLSYHKTRKSSKVVAKGDALSTKKRLLSSAEDAPTLSLKLPPKRAKQGAANLNESDNDYNCGSSTPVYQSDVFLSNVHPFLSSSIDDHGQFFLNRLTSSSFLDENEFSTKQSSRTPLMRPCVARRLLTDYQPLPSEHFQSFNPIWSDMSASSSFIQHHPQSMQLASIHPLSGGCGASALVPGLANITVAVLRSEIDHESGQVKLTPVNQVIDQEPEPTREQDIAELAAELLLLPDEDSPAIEEPKKHSHHFSCFGAFVPFTRHWQLIVDALDKSVGHCLTLAQLIDSIEHVYKEGLAHCPQWKSIIKHRLKNMECFLKKPGSNQWTYDPVLLPIISAQSKKKPNPRLSVATPKSGTKKASPNYESKYQPFNLNVASTVGNTRQASIIHARNYTAYHRLPNILDKTQQSNIPTNSTSYYNSSTWPSTVPIYFNSIPTTHINPSMTLAEHHHHSLTHSTNTNGTLNQTPYFWTEYTYTMPSIAINKPMTEQASSLFSTDEDDQHMLTMLGVDEDILGLDFASFL